MDFIELSTEYRKTYVNPNNICSYRSKFDSSGSYYGWVKSLVYTSDGKIIAVRESLEEIYIKIRELK